MKTGKLTRQEIDDTLSSAVRSAASSTEKTQALKLARDMLGLESEKANADPEAILKYITSTAGKTHQEIAQDMGGIRRALETVLAFLKVPHSTGLRVLGRMYRDGMATSKATQGEDTQAGKDLLPDGESDNINDGDDIDTPREAAEGDGEGGLA